MKLGRQAENVAERCEGAVRPCVWEDPDGALRRAIRPRKPTADVCRSLRDRKKTNDSKCAFAVGMACVVWKKT